MFCFALLNWKLFEFFFFFISWALKKYLCYQLLNIYSLLLNLLLPNSQNVEWHSETDDNYYIKYNLRAQILALLCTDGTYRLLLFFIL